MQERQSRPILRARRSITRAEQGGANRTPRIVPNDSSPRMSSNPTSEVTEALSNQFEALSNQLTPISNGSASNNTPKRSEKTQRPKIVARRRIPKTTTQNISPEAETEASSTSTPDPINTIPALVTQSLLAVTQITSTPEPASLSAELSSEAVKDDTPVPKTKAASKEITESCEKEKVKSDKNEEVIKENNDAVDKKEEEKADIEEIVFQKILRQKMVCDICMTHMKLFRCSKCFYSMCKDCTITITRETPGSVKCPHCREEQQCFMQIRLPKF